MNRQLASFGFEHAPLCGHDVAQIPMLEALVKVGANLFALDVNLHAPAAGAKRRILQRAKAGFAHHALEHHAARNLGGNVQRHQFFGRFVVKRCKQRLRAVGGLEVVGEGNTFAFHLRLANRFELFAPLDDELVFVGKWRGLDGGGGSWV